MTLAQALYAAIARAADQQPVPADEAVPYGHWTAIAALVPEPDRVAWVGRLKRWRTGTVAVSLDDPQIRELAETYDAAGAWSAGGYTLETP